MSSTPIVENPGRLRAIKIVHTAAWAIFAGCIVALPVASSLGAHAAAGWLALVVAGEVLVLALNRWTCPLTKVAARFTADRRDNFDIYLPLWLARHNKGIFGTLYALGLVFAATLWLLGV